jgi:putative transposase
MNNHFHLIVYPSTKLGLSKGMHRIDGVYAEYFNQKYQLTGHLWQDRFFACVLDNSHFWKAVRYVERNPVRANMVSRAEKYRWSSAAAHCGQRGDPLLSEIPMSAPHDDWRDWLAEGLPEEEQERIRRATRRGAPYASESFIRELERLLDLRLLPRKTGPISSS